jgi:hypothetical protein
MFESVTDGVSMQAGQVVQVDGGWDPVLSVSVPLDHVELRVYRNASAERTCGATGQGIDNGSGTTATRHGQEQTPESFAAAYRGRSKGFVELLLECLRGSHVLDAIFRLDRRDDDSSNHDDDGDDDSDHNGDDSNDDSSGREKNQTGRWCQ